MKTTPRREDMLNDLVAILTDMSGDVDLGFSGGINADTKIIADLSFESIEIVHLLVRIEQHYKLKNLATEKLLMQDGRFVTELTVAQVVDFVEQELKAQ